jgi:hypothetical protein
MKDADYKECDYGDDKSEKIHKEMAPHLSFGHPLPKGRGGSMYFQSRVLVLF